jgi:pimeloyl-ACP methyl ester carboxylesterase
VVLLHGFPDTPHSWSGFEQALVDAGYRVSVPWLRGYHPENIVAGRDYGAETIGRDVLALLDAIEAERAVVIGHDWGALMTYSSATLDPERVRAIVTSGIPHPLDLPRTPRTLWAARHFIALKMPWAASTCRRRDYAYLVRLYRRWSPSWSGLERDACLRHAKDALSSEATLAGAIGYYRDLSFKPLPLFEKAPPVPGLIIGGADDLATAPYPATAARLPAPSRALLVDGAGHWPHREDEPLVTREVLAFLGEVKA